MPVSCRLQAGLQLQITVIKGSGTNRRGIEANPNAGMLLVRLSALARNDPGAVLVPGLYPKKQLSIFRLPITLKHSD
jgi:hypothetical protein